MTGLFLTEIGHLTTNDGDPVTDAVVVTAGDRIVYAGPSGDAPAQGDAGRIECEGRAVLPGLVDAHTHVVFAGDRSDEFSRRHRGESYTQIAAAGGGILSTVESTRKASGEALFELAAERVGRIIASGVTTIEVKSGYGLDLETEMRLLEVARRLAEELEVEVKATFLGAHAVPSEYLGDRDGYVRLLVEEMIPAVASLADYCDVFVEEGAFDVDEGRQILLAAADHGLEARVHAEQLSHSGGAALAAEIGAASADHLDHATADDGAVLAEAEVAAVLVPGANYTLGTPPPPAPMLWDSGCVVGLGTDCNPGTSFVEGMGLVISLAVVSLGLTTEEALWAATRGSALSLGLDDRGTIAPGMIADLVVLDAPNPAHIAYRPATNLVWTRVHEGQWGP